MARAVEEPEPGQGPRPVRDQMLVFGEPQLLGEEIEEMLQTLRSGWIGMGPRVAAFENDFARYVGSCHAVAVSSCTAALHLAMIACDIRAGAEVIVPAMTFVSTANAVVHAGGTPALADVDRTGCIDPESAAQVVTERTRAIVPVHFAGRPCRMDALLALGAEHGLHVIEDCAHAIETMYDGRHAGTLGRFGAFSFYATKNVVTGEGGMLTTDDTEAADRLRRLALHGLSADAWKRYSDEGFRHYELVEPGFKYNMTDMQAALGVHQLRRVEENLVRRQEIWRRYDEAFADLPVLRPSPEEPGTRHARHLYTLLLDLEHLRVDRDDVLAKLYRFNIGTGVHYRAVHLHPYYRERYGYRLGSFPTAEWISDRTLSLPLSPKLTDGDVEDVVAAVRRALQGHSP
jgi:dTDP-4-amino-4,6-dideoxygalactose transaminase